MLPGVDSSAFRVWLERLIRTNVFPEGKQSLSLRRLARGTVEAVDNSRDPRPTIAIIAADPIRLAAGPNNPIAHLVAKVEAMGCRPVLVPPCADFAVSSARRADAIAALADRFDGVLGPGGDDVDPKIYRARNRFAVGTKYVRDRFEADFVLAAMQRLTFLFGICRSHQLWNAARGGEIHQDVVEEGISSVSRRQTEAYGLPDSAPFAIPGFIHRVKLLKQSRVRYAASDAASLVTNALHHAAVKTPGRGLRVTAKLFDKGTRRSTIEATEAWNVITTQFHPEKMDQDPIETQLLGTLGRRAHILRMVKDHPGIERSVLMERMRKDPRYLEADYQWVDCDLIPRLSALMSGPSG
jgi:putative glutamine amidotransferase